MTEKQERKKHKKRTPQECPYCHKFYGNLKNHILMKHQAETGQEMPLELTREDLVGPKAKEPPAEVNVYHCNNCGAKLRKGENPCWQCGQMLLWDGIE